MIQNVIVLSASQYEITNDKTGELENSGCTVRYIMSEDTAHVENDARRVKGYVPAKANMPFEVFDDFNVVPGLYAATLDFSVDSKGKAALAATDFKFISAISVNKVAVKPQ